LDELEKYQARLGWLMRRTGMTVDQIDKHIALREVEKMLVNGEEGDQ
jgi:hypothetical protein